MTISESMERLKTKDKPSTRTTLHTRVHRGVAKDRMKITTRVELLPLAHRCSQGLNSCNHIAMDRLHVRPVAHNRTCTTRRRGDTYTGNKSKSTKGSRVKMQSRHLDPRPVTKFKGFWMPWGSMSAIHLNRTVIGLLIGRAQSSAPLITLETNMIILPK